jgi:hypothetical protein
MAGVVTGETIPRAIPGAIVETEGMPTGFIWRGLSEAEAEAQQPPPKVYLFQGYL